MGVIFTLPAARAGAPRARIAFDRRELAQILGVYSRRVMQGDWKDYAIDFGDRMAVFSIFNGRHRVPVYAVAKFAGQNQVLFAVFSGPRKLRQSGELSRVLDYLQRRAQISGG